mmetsp:Transcript_2660/g.9717  ORF Transcript_2660/g.9717 Transcript_2660/m.9717 type:complete len:85 (+) Transcript_2660:1767-2021(+)
MRRSAAREFLAAFPEFRIPLALDPIGGEEAGEESNPFDAAYAPWPIRLFGIDADGKIAFVSDPVQARIEVGGFFAWLESVADKK